MRVKGSCKFEDYYRLQKWDDRFCAWQPVKTFPTLQEAEKAMKGSHQYRIYRISMNSEPTLMTPAP